MEKRGLKVLYRVQGGRVQVGTGTWQDRVVKEEEEKD